MFNEKTFPGMKPGTLWIHNSGRRSLRFQTADGLLYRVCAGNVQPLTPGNRLARIALPSICWTSTAMALLSGMSETLAMRLWRSVAPETVLRNCPRTSRYTR